MCNGWSPFSGWARETDLMFDGEVVRHYPAFDLLELDLNELGLKNLCKQRGSRER